MIGHELLVRKGANDNLCMEDNASPLYAACMTGHHNNVQTLLNKGANVNICDKKGIYPLDIACFNSQESTVQVLLANRQVSIYACKMVSVLSILLVK